MAYRKKLIEVSLPLQVINRESAREKSIRHGHPSTLHLWWARRPLAACRAVIFASLVDDPGNDLPEPEAEKERQRLFGIIERLVNWDNVNDERVLEEAREEIRKSTGGDPPAIFDPFCGGGSIPLEAQRLGLKAYASDLNPVAVLITKALIEIPPRFAGKPPVNPRARRSTAHGSGWRGAAGLAEDIRYYGEWMRDEAQRRIGHLYPKGPNGETVIAWLWARTVHCPNPACGIEMPLVRSFMLSTRQGHEAWVEPVVDRAAKRVRFRVHQGAPPDRKAAEAGTKVGRGLAKFRCPACTTIAEGSYIKAEGRSGRMGASLMAIVAEGRRGRIYVPAIPEHVTAAASAQPKWRPEGRVPEHLTGGTCVPYGLTTWGDLFTPRQLVALTTFSDLVGEARERVLADAKASGMADDGVPLHQGGHGATAYADAVATYLALAVDRVADRSSTLCSWDASPKMQAIRNTFGRQALPMTWDYAEGNPFSGSSGNLLDSAEWVAKVIASAPSNGHGGTVRVAEASSSEPDLPGLIICTDPPYYDNVGYADLADFFYVWLRRSLRPVWPELFRTVLTPKSEELVVNPYRFDGDRDKAEAHFREGMRKAFEVLQRRTRPDYPASVFYAFKQTESEDAAEEDEGSAATQAVASRGWEAMLTGLVDAGFQINGTWPMRTEMGNRQVARGTNALASSIVLVCRPRSAGAPVASRQDFVKALRRELPAALDQLTKGGIAPVDLEQAAIGPGMAIFSRYKSVVRTDERDGQPVTVPMSVREALELINRELDAFLSREQGELDNVSRFCLAWFEQYGFGPGPYGEADVIFRARNTSEHAVRDAAVARLGGGVVQLLPLHRPGDEGAKARGTRPWPAADGSGVSVWGAALRMAAALAGDVGAEEAGRIYAAVGWAAERARDLAYRLYSLCERKGLGEDAQLFNDLVASWQLVRDKAATMGDSRQARLV